MAPAALLKVSSAVQRGVLEIISSSTSPDTSLSPRSYNPYRKPYRGKSIAKWKLAVIIIFSILGAAIIAIAIYFIIIKKKERKREMELEELKARVARGEQIDVDAQLRKDGII